MDVGGRSDDDGCNNDGGRHDNDDDVDGRGILLLPGEEQRWSPQSTPPPSPTHPSRPSRRWKSMLIEEKAVKVSYYCLAEPEESVQYVSTVQVANEGNWKG